MTPTLSTTSTPSTNASATSPERIHTLAIELQNAIEDSLDKTVALNTQMRLLALNAQIEAVHAGSAGAGFGVVAKEMIQFAKATAEVFRSLEVQSKNRIQNLVTISDELGSSVRGVRLADLAHTNIDLVDRCLYERTCDVRWWATDAAVVSAVQTPTAETATECCRRLAIILKAYTVYLDIVVCDLNGRIIANGREGTYDSVGRDCSNAPWFKEALKTASGDEFGFESGHRNALVGGASVLAYSCKIGENGAASGPCLGVICVLFNWGEFSERIVKATPLSPEEWGKTRVALVDPKGFLLADSAGSALNGTIDLPNLSHVFRKGKTYTEVKSEGANQLLGFALSPGFETYSTGWGSVILQER